MAAHESTIRAFAFRQERSLDVTDADRTAYNNASSMIIEIRAQWHRTCNTCADELGSAISTLFSATMATAPLVDLAATNDAAYFPAIAGLAQTAGIDLSIVDPHGDVQRAADEMAALMGGEAGALIFAIIETANQGNIGDADRNITYDDLIAASDPAIVEALLLQVAEQQGKSFDPDRLDALVSQIVGAAWLMRASEDEAWEDIDEDPGFWDSGWGGFLKHEVLPTAYGIAVGTACGGALVVTAPETLGGSLGGAGMCAGLSFNAYNAADRWADGGDFMDIAGAYTNPWTFAQGVVMGVPTRYVLGSRPIAQRVVWTVENKVFDNYPGEPRSADGPDPDPPYMTQEYVRSVAEDGLMLQFPPGWQPEGPYLYPRIQLPLPLPGAVPNATVEIDVEGMRAAGYDLPAPESTGLGYGMTFEEPIPGEFVNVVVPPPADATPAEEGPTSDERPTFDFEQHVENGRNPKTPELDLPFDSAR